jgi:hypothetical protein
MHRVAALVFITLIVPLDEATPQRRRTAAPKPVPPVVEPADITCPARVGAGVKTGRSFCDVLAGMNPAEGIIVRIPVHSGEATLSFDLHNRHTYSEEQAASPARAYRRYAATIGVLTMEGGLISRAAVLSEFRVAADLLDRIGGGAGPRGLKAVAPTGLEAVAITIPADVNQVSILGEKLEAWSAGGRDVYTAPGRPVALISNVMIEYRRPR